MLFKAFALVLSLVGAVTPYPGVKRTDEIKIYAYGTGISGLQVYGGIDGMYLDFGVFHNNIRWRLGVILIAICAYRQGLHCR